MKKTIEILMVDLFNFLADHDLHVKHQKIVISGQGGERLKDLKILEVIHPKTGKMLIKIKAAS